MTEERLSLGEALRARGAKVIARQHVEHRVALVARVKGDAAERDGQRRQDQVLQTVDEEVERGAFESGRVLALCVEERVSDCVVELDSTELQQDGKQEHRCRQQEVGSKAEASVEKFVLPHRADHADEHADGGADYRADHQQAKTYPDATAELFVDAVSVEVETEVAANDMARPRAVPLEQRHLVVDVRPIEHRVDRLFRNRRVGGFVVAAREERRRCEEVSGGRGDDHHHDGVQQPPKDVAQHPCPLFPS